MVFSAEKSIHICRVYSPPLLKEGVWILVDRLWPRGLKKETLDFDFWLKDISPSTALRKWFHADPAKRWEEFVVQYHEELENKRTLITQILDMAKQGPVTLFFAAKDSEHNHALVLQHVLFTWPNLRDR